MAFSPRPTPAFAGALLLSDLDRVDRLLPAALHRTAAAITIRPEAAARRAIRHRLLRRKRRLRHSLGTGTLAAGLVAGLTHQLWTRALLGPVAPPADATLPETPPPDAPTAASTAPAAPTAPVPAPAPGPAAPASPSSWTWDPATDTDRVAADPAALYAAGTWHVYATSATYCPADPTGTCTAYRVPRYTSPDLAEPGRLAGDALPELPAWVDPDHPEIWAPSVARVGGRYVLWFSASDGQSKCLGAAVASRPEGPFAPLPHPLRCAPGYWAIDPAPVSADGRWFLVWREDDVAHPTGRIVAAELTADGLALAAPEAEPATLLVGRSPWEDATPGPGIGPIENPALARHPVTGEWLLTWSANSWTSQRYATGLARCDGPLGPCRRVSDAQPWLGTDADIATDAGTPGAPAPGFGGAGGLTFAVGPDRQLYAVFHAYPGRGEHPGAVRAGWVARVEADPQGGPGHPYRLVAIGRNHSADPSVEEV